jgi:hypothetical protein
VDRSHENFSDTFPDELCGIPLTTTIRGLVSSTEYSDGTVRTLSSSRAYRRPKWQVIEDLRGRAGQGRLSVRPTRPTRPRSRMQPLTFISTQVGLTEKLSIRARPTLTLDAGSVTMAQTFRVNPDGSLAFVSLVLSGLHGPHPDLLSGFELFCDLIVSALTSGLTRKDSGSYRGSARRGVVLGRKLA